jgi:fructokinase
MSEEKKKYRIVGIGEILWDVFPDGKQLGGAPANFVYHAQALGCVGFPVSAVGNDKLGREIQYQLGNIGLDQSYLIVDEKHPTGTVTVALDTGGVPDFTIHEGVAWDYIPYSTHIEELAEKTDAVCFGSLAQRSEVTRDTIRNFLDATSDECLRVFDVNLRQSFYNEEVILSSLQRADIVKLNEKELPVVGGLCGIRESELESMKHFIDRFRLQLVVLTKGEKGSILMNSDEYSMSKAPVVDVVDTVGAGDAFTAAVVLGQLERDPLELISKKATMLSAYVCTQKGATPEFPVELLTELLK